MSAAPVPRPELVNKSSDTRRTEGPPVAPLGDEKKPSTLADLYRKAIGAKGPHVLVEWIFLEARAAGRLEVAQAQLKRLGEEDYLIRSRAYSFQSEAARSLAMEEEIHPLKFHKAEIALSDAREQLSVCARMIALLGGQKP